MKLDRRGFIKKLGIGVAGVAAVASGLNPLTAVASAKPTGIGELQHDAHVKDYESQKTKKHRGE